MFTKSLLTLWTIWSAWRMAIHEQNYNSLISPFAFIVRFIDNLNMVSKKQIVGRALRSVSRVNRWIVPSDGMYMIIVDVGILHVGNNCVIGIFFLMLVVGSFAASDFWSWTRITRGIASTVGNST